MTEEYSVINLIRRMNFLRAFFLLFVIWLTSCQITPGKVDSPVFSEGPAKQLIEYWDGWTVVLHPDNGYRWIEYRNQPYRIYIVRKRRQVLVKYFVDGCWKLEPLADLPLANSDNQLLSDKDFRTRVEWLMTKDVVYLRGDSTFLQIQTKTFARQFVKNDDNVVCQDWKGNWSR